MNTTAAESQRSFLPGMGVDWLLPLYDPLTRLLGLDTVRRNFLLQADLRPGLRVIDVGCGTGTLAVLMKSLFPDVDVVGLDPDEKALARAGRKARRRGALVRFERGYADALAYPDGYFDRVFSSFMFHHLGRDEKRRMVGEARRVLKPGGVLHLLDFAGPNAGDHRPRPHLWRAHHRLEDNDEHTIGGLLNDAGLTEVMVTENRAWLGGTRIVTYRASSPATPPR